MSNDLLAAESLIAECRAFLPEWRATVRAVNTRRMLAEQSEDDAVREIAHYRALWLDAFRVGCDQAVTIAYQGETIAMLREALTKLREERSTWQRITRGARAQWAERLFGRRV